MSTVAIIGAGDLGGAVAQALAARDLGRRVVLIDADANAAAGKALDIQQSGAVTPFHTAISATDDMTRVVGANVCIVADGFCARSEWQGEEGLAMLARVVPYTSSAPIVFAGAYQGALMLSAAREVRIPARRLIGSAPQAFASAVRAIVALEAQCSANEVMLDVLGSPGEYVIPWSDASIGGYSIERVLTAAQIARVEARSARLWPPGPYTLGSAAASAAAGILSSSRCRFSALTLLDGQFGIRNRIGALPVLLNESGIADVRVPALNTRERVMIETSLS